jgi:hypothetical protein
VAVGDLDYGQPLVLDGERLYLRRYWRDETLVADSVRARALARTRSMRPRCAPGSTCCSIARGAEHKPDWQKLACAVALRGSVAIITGGPGTGKTYTVARLLALLFATAPDAAQQRIALAAPTGKAAARLKQSIDKALTSWPSASAIALPLRELTGAHGRGAHPAQPAGRASRHARFAHHRGNPLDVDVLIVDEASMVHLEMMAALLDALPPGATLILLGDKDQLASVEAGAVLGDLCHDAQAGNYSRHPDLRAGRQRRRDPDALRGSRRRAGPANRDAAPQPPLRRPDRQAGAGRERRRREAAEAVLRAHDGPRARCAGSSTRTSTTCCSWRGDGLPALSGTAESRAPTAIMRTGCAPCCSASRLSASCARCAKGSGASRA